MEWIIPYFVIFAYVFSFGRVFFLQTDECVQNKMSC